MWIKYRDLHWPPEKKVVLLHRKKTTECALAAGISTEAMPYVHRGCNSPCNSDPAQAVLAACPAGIPACLLSHGHRASLRSRMAVVRCLSKTAVWSLQREVHLQTKQWLIGWMLRKKDWMSRCCVPAAHPDRLLSQTVPGHGLVGHPHTQPTSPGRIGDTMVTGVCNVHAHVHTKKPPDSRSADAEQQILLWSTQAKWNIKPWLMGDPHFACPVFIQV